MGIDPVTIAITIALDAAMMAMTAAQHIEGPRVKDLTVTVADYGTPIPSFIGTRRVECPCFYAEPIKEVKKKRKTKGGKYSEYTYFGTWASMITEGEIQSYRKVFFDRHLIYNATTGANVFTEITGYELSSVQHLFYGTEDQVATERMIAYVEDQEGPGLCPDYLGVAYIFYEDVPLEKLGNRLPQVSVIASTRPPLQAITGTVALSFWSSASAGEFVKDSVKMGIGFLDGAGVQIGSTTYSTLVNNNAWAHHSVSAVAPVGAFAIRFFMYIHKGFGTHSYYGFIDDIEATLDGDPLPLVNGDAEEGVLGWTDSTAYQLFTWPTVAGVTPHGGSAMFGGSNAVDDDDDVIAYQDLTSEDLAEAIAEGAGLTLQDVCEYISDRVGLSSTDYDFSAFTQPLYGYSWTQGPAKSILAPLPDVFDCDIRPSGFLIEGVNRGGDLAGDDISFERLVRENDRDSSSSESLYQIKTASESDLPRRVFVMFADVNADHQPNTAVFQRNAVSVETVRELSIDLTTLALAASDAQPLVERYVRRQWMGSVTLTCKHEPAELLMDPADVRNVLLDEDIAIRGRITHLTRQANRVMRAVWERDAAAINVVFSSPGAEQIGRPPSEVYSLSGTEGFALDVPLLIDAHDQTTPFLYLAAGPEDPDALWPGADFWNSLSGEDESWSAGWDGVGASQAATWGEVAGTLPDALSSVVDEGSELVVNIFNGELESIDQATFDSSASTNIAVVGSIDGGWEILQFRSAVLQSVDSDGLGQYLITGLRRGMRGTEAQTAEHGSSDKFLLLDSMIKKHDLGVSEIGTTEYLRVNTLGSVSEVGEDLSLDFTAATRKPYSPVHAELVRNDVTGDWTIGFVRRSRLGGALIDGRDVPLGETGELYRIRIQQGSSGATRTIETTSQTGNIYTAAEQVADWGIAQTTLAVEIVQVAPDLDLEGFALAAAA